MVRFRAFFGIPLAAGFAAAGSRFAFAAEEEQPPPAESAEPPRRRKVVVVGAGIVGLTSAYYLSKESSHLDVVLVGPPVASDAACYQNGGIISTQLTPWTSYPLLSSAWNALLRPRHCFSNIYFSQFFFEKGVPKWFALFIKSKGRK